MRRSLLFLFACITLCISQSLTHLGTFPFTFRGKNYTAEYALNFGPFRFGMGCIGDYVPAVYPTLIKFHHFFKNASLYMQNIGCYLGGERLPPFSPDAGEVPKENRTQERHNWFWKFNGETEEVPAYLWRDTEPNNDGGGGENYIWLLYNGLLDVPDWPKPQCCMKIISCDPPCAHGRCVGPNQCECDDGFEGRDCASESCPGRTWGKDCKLRCICGEHGFCTTTTSIATGMPVCTCFPGYSGKRCQDECTNGTWGAGCSEKCKCEGGRECDHITGECECVEGCQSDITPAYSTAAFVTALAVSLLLAVVQAAVIVRMCFKIRNMSYKVEEAHLPFIPSKMESPSKCGQYPICTRTSSRHPRHQPLYGKSGTKCNQIMSDEASLIMMLMSDQQRDGQRPVCNHPILLQSENKMFTN